MTFISKLTKLWKSVFKRRPREAAPTLTVEGTSMEILVNATLLALLQLAKDEHLDGCSVVLFANDIDPGPETVLADLVLATFDGYTPKTVTTWTDPYLTQPGRGEMTGGILTWTVGALGGTDSIYGYAIKSVATGTPLWSIVRFAEPVQMQEEGDTLALAMRTQMPANLGGIVM